MNDQPRALGAASAGMFGESREKFALLYESGCEWRWRLASREAWLHEQKLSAEARGQTNAGPNGTWLFAQFVTDLAEGMSEARRIQAGWRLKGIPLPPNQANGGGVTFA